MDHCDITVIIFPYADVYIFKLKTSVSAQMLAESLKIT
jgi:hypothetical protein